MIIPSAIDATAIKAAEHTVLRRFDIMILPNPPNKPPARKSSPAAPIVAQPTLQEPTPFHGADAWPGNRRLRLRLPPLRYSMFRATATLDRLPQGSSAACSGPVTVASRGPTCMLISVRTPNRSR